MPALRRGGPTADGKPRMTRSNVRRYISVAGVIMPAVSPLIYQGAALVRDQWDQAKARRLGVPAERLSEFTGKGTKLHARLAGLATATAELRSRRPDQAEFADTNERRLADLAAAVRAAEQMPATRRRAAHRAVAVELDALEQSVLSQYELS